MSFLPINGRIPFLLNQNIALRNILTAQERLAIATNELGTGRRIFVGSDDPVKAGLGAIFQSLQERKGQFLTNVQAGSTALSMTENTLHDLSNTLNIARSTVIEALNIPPQPNVETAAYIAEIDAVLADLRISTNSKHLDRFMFSGQQILDDPFQVDGTGIVFRGDNSLLQTLRGPNVPFPVNITPNGSVGTDSVEGHGGDVDPFASTATRLSELNGGAGVNRGKITITHSALPAPVIVDLTNADDIGDVITAIDTAGAFVNFNAELVGGPAGTGDRIAIHASIGDTIKIEEFSGGTTARDLGILQLTPSIPDPDGILPGGPLPAITGLDFDPAVTLTTPLAFLDPGGLGSGLFTAPGSFLNIDQSPVDSSTGRMMLDPVTLLPKFQMSVDLSTLTTVEDLLNAINNSGLRVRAEINAAKDGIDVVNVLAGSAYTITGTPAQNTTLGGLGVMTTTLNSLLADFNNGQGINTLAGSNDFRIIDGDGGTDFADFDMDVGTAMDSTGTIIFSIGRKVETVLQLKTLIEGAFTGPDGVGTLNDIDLTIDPQLATFTPGAELGGGLLLTEVTSGLDPVVVALNGSGAARNLGIDQVAAGGVITGTRQYEARVKGVFDSLLRLRDALINSNPKQLEVAALDLDNDLDRVLDASGRLGAQLQSLDNTAQRIRNEIDDAELQESDALEPDLSELVTNILLQQNALQASLLATSRVLETSLFDFI